MFHKISKESKLFESTWQEAQEWCNFVLFKPETLPEGISEITSQMRSEASPVRASHKSEFGNQERRFSLKQFLYDWAPPAYDHPSLWMNPNISNHENTPIPRPHLIGNNYLWIGLDHRRKPAASMNIMRTQLELTVTKGEFSDEEILQIFSYLKPVDTKAIKKILSYSYAELSRSYRGTTKTISVPVSYFRHNRSEEDENFAYTVPEFTEKFPDAYMQGLMIDGYKCDSVFAFGWQDGQHLEVEYLFESALETGTYVRMLITPDSSPHKIPYPAVVADQECNYAEIDLGEGAPLYHAWSKLNENGSHTLIFKMGDVIINCIIKPAPWTTIEWVRELCEKVYNYSQVEK